jgi:hypothetical protein
MPQPVAMEQECRDDLNLPGEGASCQRFSETREIFRSWRVAQRGECHARTPLGAQSGRGAERWIKKTPGADDYDVSAIDATVESLGGAQTKGDAPMRGNNAPRASRTLPHCGQRTGSAGSMLLGAAEANANFGNSSLRASRKRACRCRLASKP